jgi:hypothetical protein
MSSQTASLDSTALTLILFLAIYLYVRATVVWIASLSNRYADRAARQSKASLIDDLIGSAALRPGARGPVITQSVATRNREHSEH